jgi:hypothetical protein
VNGVLEEQPSTRGGVSDAASIKSAKEERHGRRHDREHGDVRCAHGSTFVRHRIFDGDAALRTKEEANVVRHRVGLELARNVCGTRQTVFVSAFTLPENRSAPARCGR